MTWGGGGIRAYKNTINVPRSYHDEQLCSSSGQCLLRTVYCSSFQLQIQNILVTQVKPARHRTRRPHCTVTVAAAPNHCTTYVQRESDSDEVRWHISDSRVECLYMPSLLNGAQEWGLGTLQQVCGIDPNRANSRCRPHVAPKNASAMLGHTLPPKGHRITPVTTGSAPPAGAMFE